MQHAHKWHWQRGGFGWLVGIYRMPLPFRGPTSLRNRFIYGNILWATSRSYASREDLNGALATLSCTN